jgi:uncharacterized YigZ family protein
MGCIRSLRERATFEINVKRSRFIGNCVRVRDEESARSFIKEISAIFPDASHNCWAYRISSTGREVANYSDAGEPHGSAGMPILGAIDHLGLSDVTVVVTRYFGGIKLGVRGLIEAYGNTALETLKKAGIVDYCRSFELKLRLDYSRWNDFTRLLSEGKDYTAVSIDYAGDVSAVLLVIEENWSRVTGLLDERRIGYEKGSEMEMPFPAGE